MKRIVLAAITCLSLLVALPAVSAAHSSGHQAGRDHRPDDRGGQRNRPGDRHRRHDRERRDRLEHFRAHAAGTAGAVQSFQNGVLTITLPDGTTAAGTVTGDTRVSCEGMDRDSSSHDGGSGHSGSGDNGDRRDNGDRGDDNGNRRDEKNDPSCLSMLHQPGTTVRDAELSISQGSAIWREIELGA